VFEAKKGFLIMLNSLLAIYLRFSPALLFGRTFSHVKAYFIAETTRSLSWYAIWYGYGDWV